MIMFVGELALLQGVGSIGAELSVMRPDATVHVSEEHRRPLRETALGSLVEGAINCSYGEAILPALAVKSGS